MNDNGFCALNYTEGLVEQARASRTDQRTFSLCLEIEASHGESHQRKSLPWLYLAVNEIKVFHLMCFISQTLHGTAIYADQLVPGWSFWQSSSPMEWSGFGVKSRTRTNHKRSLQVQTNTLSSGLFSPLNLTWITGGLRLVRFKG